MFDDWRLWPELTLVALDAILATTASLHVLSRKREPSAAMAWMGFIWALPLLGLLVYISFGINRIERRATRMRRRWLEQGGGRRGLSTAHDAGPGPLMDPSMRGLACLVERVTQAPLTGGNRITPLVDSEAAFTAMLAAIDAADHSVALTTYIFDHDAAGERFVEALGQATARGVEVRVLIDGVGLRYSRPRVTRALAARGVPTAVFNPPSPALRLPYLNLRSHRKILVVDGQRGFTGGMNIRAARTDEGRALRLRDVHFALEGPVVEQLMHALAEDWSFATRERLEGPPWFVPLAPAGEVMARGITDGPDSDFDRLRWILLGALSAAQRSVRVVTPYFLPDVTLISGLNIAAMRGVSVELILPAKSNLRLVQWASTAHLDRIVAFGCQVYLSPPPFDHTKLMVVDGRWSLLGSTNWDPRSLSLNFEFNVECYDEALAAQLEALIDARRDASRLLSLAELRARSGPERVRDGLAALLTPYL